MRRSRTLEEFVFWHIFHCQQCLRGDLADCFGVNPATISRAIESVAAAARRGAPIAATAIGLGVANAVQILNPSLVVLCGRLASAAGESLVKAVDTIVRQRCVATATRRLEVRVSPPKKDISAVGCALLAAEAEAERLVRLCLLGGQAARRQTERWPVGRAGERYTGRGARRSDPFTVSLPGLPGRPCAGRVRRPSRR